MRTAIGIIVGRLLGRIVGAGSGGTGPVAGDNVINGVDNVVNGVDNVIV